SMVTGAGRSVLGLPFKTAAAFTILFLAAAGTYAALWRDAPVMQGDSAQYLEVAADLSDFRLDRLHDRAPGYPVLLLLTGSSTQPSRLLFHTSLLLHFASIWLLAIALAAAEVPGSWLVVFCCALILPPYVEPAAFVMTENLGQFMLAVAFVCLVLWFTSRRKLALVAAAVAVACSGLTRPVYQALAPALAASLFLMPGVLGQAGGARFSRAKAAGTGGALIAGSLLIIGSFAWLNHSKFGYFGVSPLLGFHLTTKTILLAERLPDEYAVVREILIRERAAELVKPGSTHSGAQTIWEARSELSAATGMSTAELSSYLLRMNIALMRRAPLEYLQDVARSMSTYWFPATGSLASTRTTGLRWLWTSVHFVLVSGLFLQLAALGGLAVFDLSRRLAGLRAAATAQIRVTAPQAIAYLLAGVIVFYTMILTCLLDIGEPRQRRPTDVLFIFMCFLGAYIWRQTLSADSARSRPAGPVA
ncbi:MAG TPA: hypothetical protein VLD67_20710, partial [Vicinamibacterales bacterium]|nr:hypothetical protein [Vicinamibacterales bacterium]